MASRRYCKNCWRRVPLSRHHRSRYCSAECSIAGRAKNQRKNRRKKAKARVEERRAAERAARKAEIASRPKPVPRYPEKEGLSPVVPPDEAGPVLISPQQLRAQKAHVYLSSAADFIDEFGFTAERSSRMDSRLTLLLSLVRAHDVVDVREYTTRFNLDPWDQMLEVRLSDRSKMRIALVWKMLECELGEDPAAWSADKSSDEVSRMLRASAFLIRHAL